MVTELAPAEQELEPAEDLQLAAAEIPDWLAEVPPPEAAAAAISELDVTPVEVPEWLAEEALPEKVQIAAELVEEEAETVAAPLAVIMVGANLGALAGAKSAQVAVEALTPVGLMFIATLLLLSTLALASPERQAVPAGSRPLVAEHGAPVPRLLGGIGLVLRDRYLL